MQVEANTQRQDWALHAQDWLAYCSHEKRTGELLSKGGLQTSENSILSEYINDRMLRFLFVPAQADLQLPLNRRRQPPMDIHAQTWLALVVQCG